MSRKSFIVIFQHYNIVMPPRAGKQGGLTSKSAKYKDLIPDQHPQYGVCQSNLTYNIAYLILFPNLREFNPFSLPTILARVRPEMRYFVQDQGMRKFYPQEYILIFRGLKFEHKADIGQNSHLWMGTSSCSSGNKYNRMSVISEFEGAI